MMKRRLFNLFLVLVMALSFSTAGFAQEGDMQPTGEPLVPGSLLTVDANKEAAPNALQATVSPDGFQKVSVIVTFDGPVDADAIAKATGGEVTYRFNKVFNGASMILDGGSIEQLASIDGVAKVYLDELLQPQTEVTPGFIGATAIWNALGGQENAGDGVVVGVLDTGIWPEHPSFSDPDPSGKPFTAPAVAPGSNGFFDSGITNTCDFGNTAYNPNDAPFTCNNKLIGAYQFMETYKAVNGLLPTEYDSARDDNGHGTHTTSTAAGNGGVTASIFGVNRGVISGIAPRAHVIMYRVCGDAGCYTSDSAAAVEQAILDDVDALNFSISGGSNPYSDLVSLAFLSAYDNGVFVAASAGNAGPTADSVAHREPWVTTVAASTSNRSFLNSITLTADNGDTLTLIGGSVTDGITTPTPVIFAPAADPLCQVTYPAGTFNGEIVICRRGVNARVDKGYNVFSGGAGGMILYNVALQGHSTDNHFLPTIHLDKPEGDQLVPFMGSHTGVTGVLTAGTATTVPGDKMAAFSSRGGLAQTLGISKPDITAPGVQVLAGHTPTPATSTGGLPGQLFQAIDGTSMSSPHIAGSGALLKAMHPNWTPGQIKSAMMTTAFGGTVKEDGVTPTNAFDDGSGRVDLTKAGNPGLTFDESGADYVALQSELWNSNYPSLFVPRMPGIITVDRTVTSVLGKTVKWTAYAEAPEDVKVIAPRDFRLDPGASHTFKLTVDASKVPLGEVRFATLFLTTHVSKNESITLSFPITIIRKEPVVSMTKICDPASIAAGGKERTTCAITMQNNSFSTAHVSMWDNMPKGLSLVAGSVIGGVAADTRKVVFEGDLAGALPPVISVGPGVSPAGGYLPLSLFGIAPIAGVGDESIVNFTVPSFMYAGDVYSRIGFVSNGYAVVGGGTTADVQYLNQSLPDATPPNNVLAPFWTDLNPSAGGGMRIGTLTDGVNTWLVLDWENVPNYSSLAPNDFQIWIQIGATEDITFAFGDVTLGDLGLLTVGAENRFGNSGANFYYNGTGTPPGPTVGVQVSSAPAAPGESHTVSFQAKGSKVGPWTNCAYLTSNLFQGTSVACFTGAVTGAANIAPRRGLRR